MDPAATHGYPRICGELELPIVLVDLATLNVVAVSGVVLKRLDRTAEEVVGRSVLDLLLPEDRPKATAALHALEAGIVDFYRVHRSIPSAPGTEGLGTLWVRSVSLDGTRQALIELGDGSAPQPSPLNKFLGRDPIRMAVGIVGPDWVVRSVSSDVSDVLGVTPADLVGRRLIGAVRENDVQHLLEAAQRSGSDDSVALHIDLRNGSGDWQRVCCVLSSIAAETGRLFILMPEPDEDDRPGRGLSDEVDTHLRTIAAEMDASGMLERMGVTSELAPLPEMASLTVRQWEVFSRLLLGDRVPTIATDLFISQSTVRNHLSAIYERFGVHSQADVIQLVRKRSVRT